MCSCVRRVPSTIPQRVVQCVGCGSVLWRCMAGVSGRGRVCASPGRDYDVDDDSAQMSRIRASRRNEACLQEAKPLARPPLRATTHVCMCLQVPQLLERNKHKAPPRHCPPRQPWPRLQRLMQHACVVFSAENNGDMIGNRKKRSCCRATHAGAPPAAQAPFRGDKASA
eukprot:360666-Chlamydomonas_euryale.AAC.3